MTITQPRAGEAPAARTPVRPRARLSLDAKARIIQVGVLLALLIVWQIASMAGILNPDILPSPIELGVDAGQIFGQAATWGAVGKSGIAILFAFIVGTGAGIVVGFLFGLVRVLKDAFFPVVLFFMSTPKSIFIPIFLLLFGINQTTPVFYAAFATFFYVCVNVVGGVGLVQQKHLTVVDAYGGNWWQRILDVVLPASTPGLFAAIWYGIKHSVFEVLVIELYVSSGGIGTLIHDYSNTLQPGKVLVLVLFVVVVSVLLGTLWNRLETRLDRWRPEHGAEGSITLR